MEIPTPVAQGYERNNPKPFLGQATKIFYGLVALCLIYAAVVSLANGVRLAREPYQLDYEEGNILNAAVRVDAGLTPYPPPRTWPVVLNPYGPVPYFISALWLRAREPEFFRPRITSLVATLIVASEIALLAAFFTHSFLLGICFGGFFLTIPLVQQWTPILRVDMLGLAFSLAGFVVFIRLPRQRCFAPLLFALALLCKVTFLAAPIASAFILVRRKQWLELARGTLACGLILGAAIATLQWSTHGAFLFHQFGTHADAFSWANYRGNAFRVLLETPILGALSLIGVLRQRRLSEPFTYLLVAVFGTATALKLGSNSNHFLEFEAALCISSAIGFYELQKMKAFPVLTAAMVMLCGVVLAGEGIANRAFFTSQGLVDECPQAYAYIHDHDSVLSENVGALVLTGRPVLLSNPFVYAQLVRSGTWPSGRVEKMLQEGTADLVMIGTPRTREIRWSQPALDALASSYHVTRRFVCDDASVAYEPNSPRIATAR